MIVFRVLTVERQRAGLEGLPPFYPFSSRRRSRLQLVIRSIIESGLMYTTMSIIVFITYLLKSNAIYITSAAVSDSVLVAIYFADNLGTFVFLVYPDHWNYIQPHFDSCRYMRGGNNY